MVIKLLEPHSKIPLYQQIAEQVRQHVASGELGPGDKLPTVRQLAQSLGVNQNTVLRAYLILEQETVIASKRGVGSVITTNSDDPAIIAARQRYLSNIISNDIIKVLSLGYSSEEAEAAFYLHLARWREDKQAAAEKLVGRSAVKSDNDTILIVGSHDIALNILVDLLKKHSYEVGVTNAGSLGGLIALQEERAHLAGIHLLDEETGEYNYPYVKRILPGHEVAIVHLAYRTQGLMFVRGNPKQIKGLADLSRPEVTFVNRQQGSGTRVLLDTRLHQLGISSLEINGYERELDTHLAVGSSIARGEADTGLGIEASARSCELDFLPLLKERYDLVMLMADYKSKLLSPLLDMVTSHEFRGIMDKVGGYDISETGKTILINT
jgi:molybdate-binding protein/DNA-binding transcriptional regulator YhcF (GntR family)